VEGNLGYISTGQSSAYNSFTWEYDFATDLWALKTPYEGPTTTGGVGFTLNSTTGGGGYIGTGRSANGQAGASDYLSQFFPDQVQNPNNN
jgi:hypothetical protein